MSRMQHFYFLDFQSTPIQRPKKGNFHLDKGNKNNDSITLRPYTFGEVISLKIDTNQSKNNNMFHEAH